MIRAGALVLVWLAAVTPPAAAQPRHIPRTILALYDGRYEKELGYLPIHQIAEMPLNHLGLVLRYHDINRPLPTLGEMQDVRGALSWFRSDAMANPRGFLRWATALMDAGKTFVVVGDIAAAYDLKRSPTPAGELQAFWARFGLRADSGWFTITYDWAISHQDRRIFGFERSLTGVLPAFPGMKKTDDRVRSYLTVRRGADRSTDTELVTMGPRGGYVAAGYVHFSTTEDAPRRQWYLDPFAFFAEAFGTDDLPKPDTTTVSGRRLFYSHVDGDGWRNRTELLKYRRQRATSAEVILEEVIRRYPDLPVTVAPVAGDLDPAWHGSAAMMDLARDMLKLPHVEAGSHTYGHPLAWEAMRETDGSPQQTDGPFARFRRWLLGSGVSAASTRAELPPSDAAMSDRQAGSAMRSYTVEPYSVDLEVHRSIAFINTLLPSGKRVEVLHWSGDTIPGESAIAATRAAGVRNLNGGESRFDSEFPSYGWVAPLGRQAGSQRQVYASNSNENTYTGLWTERFFGFKYLKATVENTETPRRVKPHNIYYHMYSGEKLPSLTAVLENYRYAREQELAPVTASRFAAIVDGFFSTRISSVGARSWRIENREALQTLRFDGAAALAVDYARSVGVIGHRAHQGNLYVALDQAHSASVVTLTTTPAPGPYLVHARWLLSHVAVTADGFAFRAHGFGQGVTVWKVRPATMFAVEVTMGDGAVRPQQVRSTAAGILTLDLGPPATAPVHVVVR